MEKVKEKFEQTVQKGDSYFRDQFQRSRKYVVTNKEMLLTLIITSFLCGISCALIALIEFDGIPLLWGLVKVRSDVAFYDRLFVFYTRSKEYSPAGKRSIMHKSYKTGFQVGWDFTLWFSVIILPAWFLISYLIIRGVRIDDWVLCKRVFFGAVGLIVFRYVSYILTIMLTHFDHGLSHVSWEILPDPVGLIIYICAIGFLLVAISWTRIGKRLSSYFMAKDFGD